eukprot:scaffold172_cov254-Pinguiococcus_pyrenoidosus.AAC.39
MSSTDKDVSAAGALQFLRCHGRHYGSTLVAEREERTAEDLAVSRPFTEAATGVAVATSGLRGERQYIVVFEAYAAATTESVKRHDNWGASRKPVPVSSTRARPSESASTISARATRGSGAWTRSTCVSTSSCGGAESTCSFSNGDTNNRSVVADVIERLPHSSTEVDSTYASAAEPSPSRQLQGLVWSKGPPKTVTEVPLAAS